MEYQSYINPEIEKFAVKAFDLEAIRSIEFFSMAYSVIFAFLLSAVIITMGAPVEEYKFPGIAEEEYNVQSSDDHNRIRRATCNVPIVGGIIADSACAGHCLGKGKAGGSCRNGICHCRKETIKDVWDQRTG